MVWVEPPEPLRIISLAPSLTEIVCALGLADQMVGRTAYCTYPPEISKVPVIGDYMNANLELVVAARADIVLALPEHREVVQRMRRLGLKVITTRNYSIDDILNSIEEIGRHVGQEQQAIQLIQSLRSEMKALTSFRSPMPSCLVTIGRNVGGRNLREVFVVGRNGFMQEIIALAGGVNAFGDSVPYFPKLSQETIIELNPDMIIELIPEQIGARERSALRRDWDPLKSLNAVGNGHIYQIVDQATMVPGPRFVQTLRRFVELMDHMHDSPSHQ